MTVTEPSLLFHLVSLELTTVAFVRDHLELHFDGPRLTCHTWPTLLRGDQQYRLGDSQYRNTLCALIGDTVTTTGEDPTIGLMIHIADTTLIIKPPAGDTSGHLVAAIDGFPDHTATATWRTGEGVFRATV